MGKSFLEAQPNPRMSKGSLLDIQMRKNQRKILIVDDQIFNINALKIIIQHSLKIDMSKICVKATSGKTALNHIQANIDQNR